MTNEKTDPDYPVHHDPDICECPNCKERRDTLVDEEAQILKQLQATGHLDYEGVCKHTLNEKGVAICKDLCPLCQQAIIARLEGEKEELKTKIAKGFNDAVSCLLEEAGIKGIRHWVATHDKLRTRLAVAEAEIEGLKAEKAELRAELSDWQCGIMPRMRRKAVNDGDGCKDCFRR